MANGRGAAEVYSEVNRVEGKRVHAHVTWKLKNTSESNTDWTNDMKLVPVISNPTLRIHFESNICPLRAGTTSDLKLRLRIPSEFTANHLILLLKL